MLDTSFGHLNSGLSLEFQNPFRAAGTNSGSAVSKGLLLQSSDDIALDVFGRKISPHIQSILDKFSNPRRVRVEDASWKRFDIIHIPE